MPKTTTDNRPELKLVNIGAAAIDIGSKMHTAAVNPASADIPVRMFGTFTSDLHDLADWFKACGVPVLRWNRPGSIGSRSTRSWSSAALMLFWSMHGTPRMSPGAKRM
jgi:hypothetical protein